MKIKVQHTKIYWIHATEAVFRGSSIPVNTCIKREQRPRMNNLALTLEEEHAKPE